MNIQDYYDFVAKTSRYKSADYKARFDISIYGLTGEIGSLVTEVKKQLLSKARQELWAHPNNDIIEELGDVLWYSFHLLQTLKSENFDVLKFDLKNLHSEISKGDARSNAIQSKLTAKVSSEFLGKAEEIIGRNNTAFENYQATAFLTARTDHEQLMEVCLAVLQGLAAQLMRHKLPNSERELNDQVADRSIETIVGEIVWHVSAMTSLYEIQLDEVLSKNIEKVAFREDQSEENRTPLHDTEAPKSQQLPRLMEVSFVKISSTQARMYLKGTPFGNDLTDNNYLQDDYRFHDVMHLAHMAHLGWSPVLRSLMKRKRRYSEKIDEIEDGARAAIVEEAVLKFIHSEGVKHDAQLKEPTSRLFPNRDAISFQLLKTVRTLVEGLEVHKNKYWEWENAILDGYRVFDALRDNEQGTICVDLESRSLVFSPHVFMKFEGTAKSIGVGTTLLGAERRVDREPNGSEIETARQLACKTAILESLNIESNVDSLNELELTFHRTDADLVSVKTTGHVRDEMWRQGLRGFWFKDTSDEESFRYVAVGIGDLAR